MAESRVAEPTHGVMGLCRVIMILGLAIFLTGLPARVSAQAAWQEGTLDPPELTVEELAELETPHDAQFGAAGLPAGTVSIFGAGGVMFFAPHATAGVRVATGGGTSVEARWETLMLLGQSGAFRVGWGTAVGEELQLGVAATSSISTLAPANGLFGMEFLAFELGNDWVAGGELALTWLRPEGAHLTFLLGFNGTIGGERAVDLETYEFQYDPGFRSIAASVLAEWKEGRDMNVYVRFDALLPVHTEVVPLGFLPTFAVGVTYGI